MARCKACGLGAQQGQFCGKCGERLFPDRPDHQASPPGLPPAPEEPKARPPLPAAAGQSSSEGDTNPEDGESGESLESLSQDVKEHPGDPAAYLKLARAQLAADKPERALSTYRAVKALAPDLPEVFRVGANVFDHLGRSSEAIETMESYCRMAPADIDAVLDLSRMLHEIGRHQDSLNTLETLRRKASHQPRILLRLAEVELSLHMAPQAQEDLSAFRKIAGDTRDMFLLLGQAMMAQSFVDGAIALYSDAIRLYPGDTDILLGLGRAYLAAKDRGQALLEFERASQSAPDRLEILLEMGSIYGSMGLGDKAEEMFERIRNQPRGKGEIFLEMAHFYRERNQIRKALQHLELAKRKSPHHPEVIKSLGRMLEEIGNPHAALAEYEMFLSRDPRCGWALEGIVRAAEALQDFSRSVQARKELLSIDGSDPQAWCDLGEALIRIHAFEEAEKAFEEASRIDPTCPRAYQAPELVKIEQARAEGEQLAREGQEAIKKRFFLTAIDKLEQALEMVPREYPWMQLLANTHLRIGSLDKASDLFLKLRLANPRDYETGLALARLYEFNEKVPLAIELISSLLKDRPEDIDAHVYLLRLKREQIQGERFERDILLSLLKNIDLELGSLRASSPVPFLVEGFANFLYGVGSPFQSEVLAQAEECFELALHRFEDHPWAHRGLSLIFRVRGNYAKASHHLQEVVRHSSDPSSIITLARLNEGFQHFSEARKLYTSLRNLFPECGTYRRKMIEMAARESDESGKNLLMPLLNEFQEAARIHPKDPWHLYDQGWAQVFITRRSTNSDEWIKRTLLTWNKAASLPDAPPWISWGLMDVQLEFLKGAERYHHLGRNVKLAEKLARDWPDMGVAHAQLGRCFMGYEDLSQTDRGVAHLEKALFLDGENTEIILSLIKAYRELGRSARVDAMKHLMLLLEPESLLRVS